MVDPLPATQVPAEAPKRQVISISQDGVMQSLRRKPGEGLDLRAFGQADVKRVSEVEFCAEAQQFYVRFLDGQFAGRKLTAALFTAVTGDPPAGAGVLKFEHYEDGVRAEVRVLDAVRSSGAEFNADALDIIAPRG